MTATTGAVGETAPDGGGGWRRLVSEGGGVKGIAYAGALAVLEERGVLARVDAVAGTSAGAITAALVAVGCTPDELRDIMLEVDLTTFEDGRLEGPVRLLEHFGFYRGDAFLSWIHRGIAERCGDPDATFAQVAASKVRELHVVTTDLSTHRPLVFSPATPPTTRWPSRCGCRCRSRCGSRRCKKAAPCWWTARRLELPHHHLRQRRRPGRDARPAPWAPGVTPARCRCHPEPGRVCESAVRDGQPRAERLFRAHPGGRRPVRLHRRPLLKATDFALTTAQKQELIARGRAAMERFLGTTTNETGSTKTPASS